MSLRKIMLGLVILLSVGLAGVILYSATNMLNRHFISQEKKDISLNIQQVKNTLDFQLDFLAKTGNDWSNWDDTYAFTAGEYPEFAADNLSLVTYQNLRVDFLAFIDPALNVVYSGVIGKEGSLEQRVPPEIAAHLVQGDVLVGGPDHGVNKRGLIVVDNRPMLIVSHPILRTDRGGPANGTFLLGKFIDQSLSSTLCEIS